MSPAGSVLYATTFPGPTVDAMVTGNSVSWSPGFLVVGDSGEAFWGIADYVPAEVPFSSYGTDYYAIDNGGTAQLIASHAYPGMNITSGMPMFGLAVFGPQHYVATSYFNGSAGSMGEQGMAYVDSDHGGFSATTTFLPTSVQLRATANAGGDLLVAGAGNGANLRRIDATGATVYTAPLPVQVDSLQAGPAGDAYLIGPRAAADLGCGPLSTSGDWYAARISPTGTCMWSRTLDAVDSFLPGGAHDYLTATISGRVDFGCGFVGFMPGQFSQALTAYDDTGACLWSKVVGPPISPYPVPPALLASGDPLLAGAFSGTVDVGCGPQTSPTGESMLVARLDSTGACVWSRVLPLGAFAPLATGDVAVATSFSGTFDIGTGPLTAQGGQDLLIAHLDGATGATLFAADFGAAGATLSGGIVGVDQGGGMLVRGSVTPGAVDFGSGPISGRYLLRVDGAGAFRWARSNPFTEWAYDAVCGSTTVLTLTDDPCNHCSAPCTGCGPMKTPTVTVQRFAP
jgi:hypothetical protein